MEKTFGAIATIAPGSVVVFDYATVANIEARCKPFGVLHKALLKAAREPQTFWISSEKKYLTALMEEYGFSMREQLDYGRETKRERLRGGLVAAVVLTDQQKGVADRTFHRLKTAGNQGTDRDRAIGKIH
jgi:hypothetical protein